MWPINRTLLVITATLISLAGCAWYAYSSGKQSGMLQIQAQWDSERLTIAKAHDAEMQKARQRESALQDLATKLKKERANETKRLAAEYAADLDRLRDRPEARAGASGVPEGANAGVGCTGAGLSRPDSEFLVWLGSEAARTQSTLNACLAAYEGVRLQLNSAASVD